MTERDVTRVLTEATDSLHLSARTRAAVLNEVNGGRPMKKKMTLSAVLAMGLVLVTMVIAAAEVLRFDLSDIADNRHLAKPDELEALAQPCGAGSMEVCGVVFTPMELICDEQSVVLAMEARTERKDVLLISGDVTADMPVSSLGPEYLAYENMTIAEYAEARGLTILNVGVVNEKACSNEWEDASLIAVARDHKNTDDRTVNLRWEYSLLQKPQKTYDLTVEPWVMTQELDVWAGEGVTVSLNVQPELWRVVWKQDEPQPVPACGAAVKQVTLFGTAVHSYYHIDYTVTDVDAFDAFAKTGNGPLWFDVQQADGTDLGTAISGVSSITSNGIHVVQEKDGYRLMTNYPKDWSQQGTLPAMAAAPDEVVLIACHQFMDETYGAIRVPFEMK